MPLNVAQIMSWGMDDEDHVCSMYQQVNCDWAWSYTELTAAVVAVPKTLEERMN